MNYDICIIKNIDTWFNIDWIRNLLCSNISHACARITGDCNPSATNNNRCRCEISCHGRASLKQFEESDMLERTGWALRPFDIVRSYRFCIGFPYPSSRVDFPRWSFASLPSACTRAPSWQKGREPCGRGDRLILYKGAAYLASSPRQAPLNPPTALLPTASMLLSSCSRCFTKDDPSLLHP